jgi:hypothetical protein
MENKEKKKIRRVSIKVDRQTSAGDLNITILGLPDDLSILTHLKYEEQLEIFKEFISKARARLPRRFKMPRGKFKDAVHFTPLVKRLATYSYFIIKDLLENHSEIKFTKKLVEKYEKENEQNIIYPHDGKKLKPKPHEITAFILESILGEEREKYKLNPWTDNPGNFRRIYIDWVKFKSQSKQFQSRLNSLLREFRNYTHYPEVSKNPLKAFQLIFYDLLEETPLAKIVDPYL